MKLRQLNEDGFARRRRVIRPRDRCSRAGEPLRVRFAGMPPACRRAR